MTGSNIFSPPINASSQGVWDTTTAIALKALFKSVFAFFYSLSGLFHLDYFVKCWRTLVGLKPCSDLPRLGNVKKNHKKRAMHGQIQGLFAFYQSYSQHLVRWYPLWNPLPRKLYFTYLAVFFTWVSCLAPEFGAYDRKMSLQNFQGWPKKDKMGISCDSVSSIH